MYIFANSKCVCMIKKLLSVKYIFVISLIILMLPTMSRAEAWMDSLYVKLDDAKMDRTDGKAVLTFNIAVFRPVEKWNKDDYTLGRCDFSFGKEGLRMADIFSDVRVKSLRPEIALTVSQSLQLEGNFILDGLTVSLTPASKTAAPLTIPYQEWVDLCEVSLTLANPATVEVGLLWDLRASGCITMGNVPVREKFMGDLDKIPDKLLTFTDYSSSMTVCPEEHILLYAHAVSSGDGLTCKWMQEDNGTWVDVPPTAAGQPGSEDDWATFGSYQYQLKGTLKDTLIIRGLNASRSGLTFKCVAQDLTLGGTANENTRETPSMVLQVLPQVQVALEGYTSPADFRAHLAMPNDTAYHCEGSPAKVRVALYGLTSMNEVSALKGMGGNMYVEYKWESQLGGTEFDTLQVKLADIGSTVVSGNSQSVLSSENLELELLGDGKYFIKRVWTDSCSAGVILTAFDSVVVKSRSSVAYEFDPIEYVAGSGGVNVVEGTGLKNPEEIKLNVFSGKAIGVIWGEDYSCDEGKVGTDTLYYIYKEGECTMTATRLVHVLSTKSVAIKVLLEGPYMERADSMRCFYAGGFPGTETEYESPYEDHITCAKPFPVFDRRVSDWIFVEVWDYPPYGVDYNDKKRGNRVAFTSALLLSDGTVASVEGDKYLSFDMLPEDSYYILVKHRNHLGVLSAQKIAFAAGGAPKEANTIDFTEKIENAFDRAGAASKQTPLKEIKGKYFMYAGEVLVDGRILVTDHVKILEQWNQSGYYNADFNLDGKVTVIDKNIWYGNQKMSVKY